MVSLSSITRSSETIFHSFLLSLWRELPLPKVLQRTILYLINHKFTVGVIGLITDPEGKILLFKHTYYKQDPWGLPSGIVKQESLTKALKREIEEESGIIVEVKDLWGIIHDNHRISFLFNCKVLGDGFKPSSEVSRMDYFSSNDLPDIGISSKTILETLISSKSLEETSSERKLGFVDLTGSEIYNTYITSNMSENETKLIASNDVGAEMNLKQSAKRGRKKQETRFGRGFISLGPVSSEVVPLPPYAYRTDLTPSPNNTAKVDSSLDGEPASNGEK